MNKIKYFALITLWGLSWVACTTNPSGKMKEMTEGSSLDSGEIRNGSNMGDSAAGSVLSNNDMGVWEHFGLKNVLVLLKHYEDFELAETSGLDFMFEYASEEGETDLLEYVYGKGVEKGKDEAFGYKINATSPHGVYFSYRLDTSQQANFYFADEADAKHFIEGLLKEGPIAFDDNTYYVHPVEGNGIQYLNIDNKYKEDQYSTSFVIYPPRMEDGFCRVEVEVYV